MNKAYITPECCTIALASCDTLLAASVTIDNNKEVDEQGAKQNSGMWSDDESWLKPSDDE